MKNSKLNLLFINKSEYEIKKLNIIKKKCTIYNIENPSRTKFIDFIKIKKLSKIDILVVNIGIDFNESILKLFPKLKIILTPTTGLNHLDIDYIKKKKIKLFSLKNNKKLKYVTSTAEHTWALILAITRNLIQYHNDTSLKGNWDRKKYIDNIFQLYGKTIGIVGFGRLGKMISIYAAAFGMKILIFDKKVKKYRIKNYSSLNKIFSQSDIVSINLSYDKTTHGIISKKILKKAKSNQILVNTSRGEIFDESALWSYLKSKKNRYAGLDVLVNDYKWYKKIPSNNLKKLRKIKKKIILTPHVGGVAVDAKKITRNIILELLFQVLKKNKL
tara:strand:- start:1253 stop:2242 length:990 start_codon:yes stop_codon:yes gene_type:complete